MRVSRKNPTEQKFLDWALDACREAGVAVNFKPTKSFRTLGFTTGLFFWEDKTIEVAARGSKWFDVFVHEFCHLQQALEGMWISKRDTTHWNRWEAWLHSKVELSARQLTDSTRVIQECELDAERRAAKLIRTWSLDSIDLDRYVRGANTYVYEYEASRQTRQFPKTALCYRREFQEIVPTGFIRKIDRLPRGFLDLFLNRC